jgi:hypothetical protein
MLTGYIHASSLESQRLQVPDRNEYVYGMVLPDDVCEFTKDYVPCTIGAKHDQIHVMTRGTVICRADERILLGCNVTYDQLMAAFKAKRCKLLSDEMQPGACYVTYFRIHAIPLGPTIIPLQRLGFELVSAIYSSIHTEFESSLVIGEIVPIGLRDSVPRIQHLACRIAVEKKKQQAKEEEQRQLENSARKHIAQAYDVVLNERLQQVKAIKHRKKDRHSRPEQGKRIKELNHLKQKRSTLMHSLNGLSQKKYMKAIHQLNELDTAITTLEQSIPPSPEKVKVMEVLLPTVLELLNHRDTDSAALHYAHKEAYIQTLVEELLQRDV